MRHPSYARLYREGVLEERAAHLAEMLKRCRLCPRECGVNRLEGLRGYCQAGKELTISSAFPHFGEEAPLVGHFGSGTIFLTHCNLRCVFCQNYDISHRGNGQRVSTDELADCMIALQDRGCHNINFVTPTHYIAQLVAALPRAVERGLAVPLVYNCGGYESLEVIRLLDGIIDIYMPDVKFADPEIAATYCNARDYPDVVKTVLLEMHRQVGDLELDDRGIASRGLLIRHLVMPNGTAGTAALMSFVAREVSVHSYVNIMNQYRPLYEARGYPEINRHITDHEYREAIHIAEREGLYRGF